MAHYSLLMLDLANEVVSSVSAALTRTKPP